MEARRGSRLESLRSKGRDPKLPQAPLPYLVGYLFEVGPASAGGFGMVPLTHQEILAWQENMQRRLQPWEVDMLRRMSAEYVAELRRAEDPAAPAPWDGEVVTEEERARVAESMRETMRRMAQ